MKQGTLLILELLKAAVEYYNRPVSYRDLIEFSRFSSDFPNFNFRRIREDIKRLLVTGETIKVGNSSNESGGRFVYLPINANVPETELLKISSPSQTVENAFFVLWNEKVAKAITESVLPKPILTNDIYQYLIANDFKFNDKRTLPNALLHLSQKNNPVIRKVDRKQERFSAWVPIDISDSELNLENIYGSDSERIKVAVQKCVKKYNRAVCAEEVLEEVNAGVDLQLTSKTSLAIQLNNSTKEKAYISGKLVNRHQHSIVRKAGQFNGTAYYFYGKKTDEIKYSPFVKFLNLKQRWEQSNAEKHLEEIEGCRLPTVAAGRALLVASEASKLLLEINEVINSNSLASEIKYEAENVSKNISQIIELAEEWIKSKNVKNLNLPSEVDTSTPVLTAKELLKIIKPFYSKAHEIENPNKLITLLYNDIRRVPNPNFKRRFSKKSDETASFLFDKTDALLFIALNWGGFESSFQANLAKAELGNLRDVRFIIPALNSKSFDERLSAVACLAFLQNEEGNEYLQKVITEDYDPNIRKAAIWGSSLTNNLNFSFHL